MVRPAALTFLGVLGIVWACLALLLGLVQAYSLLFIARGVVDRPQYWIMGFDMVTRLGINSLLLAASCGLLRLRPWSGRAFRIYAWVDLVLCALYTAGMIWILQTTLLDLARFGAPTHLRLVLAVEYMLPTLASFVMPVLALVLIRRQRVRDAFAGKFGDRGGFEVLTAQQP